MLCSTKSSRVCAIVMAVVNLAHPIYARTYKVINNCPRSVNLFLDGDTLGSMRSNGGTKIFTQPNDFSGLFYSDANGGSQDGSSSTRAGFDGMDDYYYEVINPDSFNMEISIRPDRSEFGSFCQVADCSDAGCREAYTNPPMDFPPPSRFAPPPPLYRCPASSQENGYTIVFCPRGQFPTKKRGTEVHPLTNKKKCIDVRGGNMGDGTPVQIYDCNDTPAQKWNVVRGQTKIQVVGSNYCLDAGTNPGNGVALKIWTCHPGLAQQAWEYTDDMRVTLSGTGQCIDLAGGSTANGNQLQLWQCSGGNKNQGWTTG